MIVFFYAQGLEHEWGELDKDAKRKEDAVTSRLAACNLDWDRVTANDLYGRFVASEFLRSDSLINLLLF